MKLFFCDLLDLLDHKINKTMQKKNFEILLNFTKIMKKTTQTFLDFLRKLGNSNAKFGLESLII